MNTSDIQERIRHFIGTTILLGQDEGLDAETPLLEWGIINSIEMKVLVRQLQSEFGVTVSPEDVLAENFSTIRAIAALVTRIRAGSGVTPSIDT